jgi:ABC-type methionine transport system permease subunit
VTTSATLTRRTGKLVTATATTTASVVRRIATLLSALVTTSATVDASGGAPLGHIDFQEGATQVREAVAAMTALNDVDTQSTAHDGAMTTVGSID